jgi:3-hydroxypropanoate dehydrogenase
MAQPLGRESLDTLFMNARSVRKWQDKPVPDVLLRELYHLTILGPTSGNCCPARFVFVRSAEGKERIIPHLTPGNVDQTRTAPVCVIVAVDTEFWRDMDPESKFTANYIKMGEKAQPHALRNGTLQGGYLILAARALGLDCGAMSGYDQAGLDAEFFPGGRVKSNFLCNIGYGDYTGIVPRPVRPPYDTICTTI